ncbi:coiled-coil domain-containing protein [Microlunatus parietis]|uniref:Chromosome segregation ATPase n=1 Tax=Microlunatus parietis TaxID=682979 RepID=A0A7Y9IBH1_9ACTN|nr:hypothetical protein [Microlunatus parietis]NYE73856.1 hypothetical protein [Microlunatus parietis]
MWHLRRVHLESVGHPDARFDPLTVNLTDIDGEPTSSVLWLENMGGKTSWLSLVFCPLRPALDDFLGRPDKYLGDYVLATDTSQILLEFAQIAGVRTLSGSGTRLLLGQVMQWKHRRQERSRESTQLLRQFWAAVVPPSGGRLTFESAVRLMHTDDDQRRPLSDFSAGISSLIEGDAFRPDNHQGRWADWLRQHGLDPEVFADELKMSADEGSISERFHFEGGDQFVQWAMPYIIPPEVPDGVATVVEGVRDTLTQRPSLLAQQQFCRTVEGKLEFAASQQTQLEEERSEAAGNWDAALRLVDQFRAAMVLAKSSVRHHKGRAEHFEDKAKRAQSVRNHRQQQGREAQLVAARLQYEEAAGTYGELTEQLEKAQLRVDAWEITGRLRSQGEAKARLAQIGVLLGDMDDRAAPLRTAVSEAELRLAAKLTSLRAVEQATVDEAEEELANADSAAAAAEEEEGKARSQYLQATSAVASAEERMRQLDDELSRAIEDGLLRSGQPLDDARASAAAERDRWNAEVERLAILADGALGTVGRAERERESARAALSDAQAEYEKAAARSEAVDAALSQLLSTPGLTAVFDAAHPDVWQDGEAAADRLSRDADWAAADRVAVELAAATDTRAVDWLNRTGLLPPSPDVEAVLDVLAAAEDIGVAFSGWDVLRRRVPVDQQAAYISRCPEIVSGVVLDGPSDLEAAAAIARSVVLTGPVVLTTMAALDGERTEPFTVLQGPAALYDENAAAAEATLREARLDAFDEEKQAARAREDEARSARAALTGFLDRHPADAVARWRTEVADRQAIVREVRERLGTTEVGYRQARATAQAATAAVQPARDRLGEVERAQEALRGLSDRQAARPGVLVNLQEAGEQLAAARRRSQKADAARQSARTREKSANEMILGLQIRISRIDDAFTRWRLEAVDTAPPDDPVDSLEFALEAARTELQLASPPSELLRERNDLQKQLAELGSLIRQANGEVVTLARTLLSGPEGATLDARETALRAAKASLMELAKQEALAKQTLSAAQDDLRQKEAIAPSRRAPLDEEPATADRARELLEQLTAQAAAAFEEHSEATDSQKHHARAADEAEQDRKAFEREAADLAVVLRRCAVMMDRPADIIDLPREESAWSGGTEFAEKARRGSQTKLDDAAEYIRLAIQERDGALDDVRHLANQFRKLLTDDLPTLIPRLTEGTADQRGAYARQLTGQLHTFALTIDKQLADVERHRRIVIEHLVGKVKETVKLLERMQRRTRMPAGLEEWSDRSFLHLTHPKLPETTEELSGKVATVVDRVCADPDKTVPSGMDLLYTAVSASIGGPFHATILKPHKRLTNERVDIGEMSVFSGGQKVTVALVMFAALTRMRTEARSSGLQTNAALPLLLDNPIGKANQATLMEVQQRVADAFGLQLIYTTGLHDVGALASFKNIVRLDGRENPRSGHVHLVVDKMAADLVYLDSIRLVQHEEPGYD